MSAVYHAGPQLDVPHDVTPKQLETLLNGLLQQEEKLPYSFFIHEQQLSDELGAHLLKNKVRLGTCAPSNSLAVCTSTRALHEPLYVKAQGSGLHAIHCVPATWVPR